MSGAARRLPPAEVRAAAGTLFTVGGILFLLALMAAGVLLSRPEIDPARQGTGYLDLILLFNGAICLLPIDALLVVLGLRLRHGDWWARIATLTLCAAVIPVLTLAVGLLQLRLGYAAAVLAAAGGLAALLSTGKARTWCGPPVE